MEKKETKKSKKQLRAEETAKLNEERKAGQLKIERANAVQDVFASEVKVRGAAQRVSDTVVVAASLTIHCACFPGLQNACKAGLLVRMGAGL
jgi:hypothetical protein